MLVPAREVVGAIVSPGISSSDHIVYLPGIPCALQACTTLNDLTPPTHAVGLKPGACAAVQRFIRRER